MKNLAMRWLEGWSAATGHPWTDEHGVIRIEALMASRRFEYLLVEPDDEEFKSITALIDGDSRDVVTVFTIKPDHYLVPHAGLVVDRDDEALMTCPLARTDSPVPDGFETHGFETHGFETQGFETQGFETQWDDRGDRASLHVIQGDQLAAAGNLAIVDHDVIFDRVETMPRFQRRGLGRFVMQSLTGWALRHEADTGILAASADGQALYETLGWHHECAMLMFRGTEDIGPVT